MKRKYYVRLMRPIFQRAILTVEATSEEAAVRSGLILIASIEYLPRRADSAAPEEDYHDLIGSRPLHGVRRITRKV